MGAGNEKTVGLMQPFRKQYLKLVLLSNLKYVTNEIFLYKMTNSHLNIFIDQFHFDSLLDQGHFVNALDSTLDHFTAWATPSLPAFSSHPVCKAKASLKWNTGTLKLLIEQNDTFSVTEARSVLSFKGETLSSERLFVLGGDALNGTLMCWTIGFRDPHKQLVNKVPFCFSITDLCFYALQVCRPLLDGDFILRANCQSVFCAFTSSHGFISH